MTQEEEIWEKAKDLAQLSLNDDLSTVIVSGIEVLREEFPNEVKGELERRLYVFAMTSALIVMLHASRQVRSEMQTLNESDPNIEALLDGMSKIMFSIRHINIGDLD